MERISSHPSSGQGCETAALVTGLGLKATGNEGLGVPTRVPGGRGSLDVKSGTGDAEILTKVIGGVPKALKTKNKKTRQKRDS